MRKMSSPQPFKFFSEAAEYLQNNDLSIYIIGLIVIVIGFAGFLASRDSTTQLVFAIVTLLGASGMLLGMFSEANNKRDDLLLKRDAEVSSRIEKVYQKVIKELKDRLAEESERGKTFIDPLTQAAVNSAISPEPQSVYQPLQKRGTQLPPTASSPPTL